MLLSFFLLTNNYSNFLEPMFVMMLIAFATYNINRLFEIEEDIINHPERASFMKDNMLIFSFLTAISIILVLYLTYQQNITLSIISSIPFFIVILYTFKIIPLGFKRVRLKDIPLIKNLTPAITWAVIVPLISLSYLKLEIDNFSLIFGLFIFWRFMVNNVSFDIRDIKGDKKHKVPTIAVLLGKEKTLNVLFVLNTIAILTILFGIITNILPAEAHFLNLINIYGYWYLWKLKKDQTHNLFDVIIDGEYLFWVLLILIGGFFNSLI